MEKSEGGDSFPPNKAQSEVVASSTVTTGVDFPAKKLARQLDFTVFGGGGGQSPAAAVTEQTQKIQPLTMTSGPQIVPVKLTPASRPQLQPLPQQPQQHMMLMPMKQALVAPTHPSIRPP